MIKQLRIDERLIHGQIATAWSKFLDIDTIVVANDEASNDEMVKKILLMGAPAGKKVAIRSVNDVIKLLSDTRAESMSILLIVDNPTDAIKLVESLNIKDINVGNFNKKKANNKITLRPNISVTKEDYIEMEKLVNVGKNVFAQLIPTDSRIPLIDLLNKHQGEN